MTSTSYTLRAASHLPTVAHLVLLRTDTNEGCVLVGSSPTTPIALTPHPPVFLFLQLCAASGQLLRSFTTQGIHERWRASLAAAGAHAGALQAGALAQEQLTALLQQQKEAADAAAAAAAATVAAAATEEEEEEEESDDEDEDDEDSDEDDEDDDDDEEEDSDEDSDEDSEDSDEE